jgi:hypothetical protein
MPTKKQFKRKARKAREGKTKKSWFSLCALGALCVEMFF